VTLRSRIALQVLQVLQAGATPTTLALTARTAAMVHIALIIKLFQACGVSSVGATWRTIMPEIPG